MSKEKAVNVKVIPAEKVVSFLNQFGQACESIRLSKSILGYVYSEDKPYSLYGHVYSTFHSFYWNAQAKEFTVKTVNLSKEQVLALDFDWMLLVSLSGQESEARKIPKSRFVETMAISKPKEAVPA